MKNVDCVFCVGASFLNYSFKITSQHDANNNEFKVFDCGVLAYAERLQQDIAETERMELEVERSSRLGAYERREELSRQLEIATTRLEKKQRNALKAAERRVLKRPSALKRPGASQKSR